MNFLKKLFRKRKPMIYTSLETDHRYREDDPAPFQNNFDRAIDWDVGEKEGKLKKEIKPHKGL